MATLVTLSECINLQTVGAVHQSLCDAFAAGEDVDIDASAFAQGDLAVIQLILAARAEAARCDRHLALTAPANPALVQLLHRCGIAPGDPADAAFWFHGDRPA